MLVRYVCYVLSLPVEQGRPTHKWNISTRRWLLSFHSFFLVIAYRLNRASRNHAWSGMMAQTIRFNTQEYVFLGSRSYANKFTSKNPPNPKILTQNGTFRSKWKCWLTFEREENKQNMSIDHPDVVAQSNLIEWWRHFWSTLSLLAETTSA